MNRRIEELDDLVNIKLISYYKVKDISFDGYDLTVYHNINNVNYVILFTNLTCYELTNPHIIKKIIIEKMEDNYTQYLNSLK